MNSNPFELIDAYLDNKLNAEEKAAFEQALSNNEELATELAVYQLEREGHELLVEADLRDKLLLWTSEENQDHQHITANQQPEAEKGRSGWKYLALLGVLASIILATYLYWPYTDKQPTQQAPPSAPVDSPQKNDAKAEKTQNDIPVAENNQRDNPTKQLPSSDKPAKNNYQQLAMAYYENSDHADLVRGSSASGTNLTTLQTAKEDFKLKKYQQVISGLETVQPSDAYYWQAQELAGHSWFKLKRFDESATIFNNISNNNKNERGEYAQWYLALSLLAQDKMAEATKQLNAISENSDPQLQEKARALLKELKY